MGLLDRIKTTGNTQTVIKYLDFTFKSLSDEQVDELLKLYRRLLIRGNKIEENKYNSVSRLSVYNREHDITFFKLGSGLKTIEGHTYKENFFQMMYKSEIWNVFCQRIMDPEKSQYSSEENPVTQFIVEYVPDKIGHASENSDELMRNIAISAMEVLESDERIQNYLNGLYDVLGKDSVEEIIKLKKSWYDMLFEDEINRNLQQANEQAKEDMGITDPQFELQLIERNTQIKYFSEAESYIPEDMSLQPKVYAISGKRFAVTRVFCNTDSDEVAGANGNQGFERYYVVNYNGSTAIVKTVEYQKDSTVLIKEIGYYDKFDIPEKALKTNVSRGIKTICDIYFKETKVEYSANIAIEQKEKAAPKTIAGNIYNKLDKIDKAITLDKLNPFSNKE